jgi:hypothetical protein
MWRVTPAKESVTIRHLLMHNSGLMAYGPLWRELQGRAQYRRRIAGMTPEYEPGTQTLYSDFGIILLGVVAGWQRRRPDCPPAPQPHAELPIDQEEPAALTRKSGRR